MKKRVKVLGCKVDLISNKGALEFVADAVNNSENMQIVTINPEMIELASKDCEFAKVLNEAELVFPDGVGVELALRLKGHNVKRIRGVDFARELIRLCSENSYRLALLGAKEEVIQALKLNLEEKFNNLNIVYSGNGYYEDENSIINDLKEASPQILLCGLGAPKQEFLIYKLKTVLSGCVMVGVGGAFDVLSGLTKEAPKIWTKLSLEWLYRTLSQPERFKRIFPALPIFLFRAIIESLRGEND